MGWRLFRRFRLAPGIRLNVSRSGPSISFGPRGLQRTISRRGVRTTVGLPGTGLHHTELEPWGGRDAGVRRCPSCTRRVGRTASYCADCGTPLDG